MAGTSLVPIVLLAAGVVALYIGAELLVAGARRLALGFGLRAATVGVTIVALATTAPELFVAVIGALDVSGDVGLGTVIGSNIANVGLVIGLAAVIRPLSVSAVSMRRHVPFMLGSAVLLLVLSANGRLSRLDGAIMLALLGAFTAYLVYFVRTDPAPASSDPAAGAGIDRKDVALVLGGLVALVVGSRWLVSGGVELLSAFGFSDLFIGLTILAIGTSLPELAASVVGAAREETQFAIGNVVGSNVYNILAVLGLVAIVSPMPVASATLRFELPALVVFTVVLAGMMARGHELSRRDGVVLLVGYGVFVTLLFP